MASKDNSDPPFSRFKPGNTDAEGNYLVGKNRTPEATRFKKGDGRKRGQRPKGQRNFATEFNEEARRLVTIREGGKERRVSKMRSAIIRAFDNAAGKGDTRALQVLFAAASKLGEGNDATSERLEAAETALLDAWIEQQVTDRLAGDDPGDPEDSGDQPDTSEGDKDND